MALSGRGFFEKSTRYLFEFSFEANCNFPLFFIYLQSRGSNLCGELDDFATKEDLKKLNKKCS